MQENHNAGKMEESKNQFMSNVYKKLRRGLGLFLTAVCLWLFIPYILSPIYRFEKPSPFKGAKYYNPYQDMDSLERILCNFHAHGHSWAGITDGKNVHHDSIFATYQRMGYKQIGISDYQRINRFDHPENDSIVSIPVYEHGYNVKKRHHLVLGADRVSWLDFFFWQTIHHKQFVINALKRDADFLIVNHPEFSQSFPPADFTRLSGYDAIEVFNHYRTSIVQWDSALSSGYYAVLAANDDMHELTNLEEVAACLTIALAKHSDRRHVADALKKGAHYGVKMQTQDGETHERRAERLRSLPQVEQIKMQGDTLLLSFCSEVARIRLVGQDGEEKAVFVHTAASEYVFEKNDAYIRIEVTDGEGNQLFFNPIARTNDVCIVRTTRAEVNLIATGIKYAAEGILLLLLLGILVRLKGIQWWQSVLAWLHQPYCAKLLILLVISVILRLLAACLLELTNDEVYYRLYALFPDWSHFDHPPMVGWMIQLFTWDTVFDHALAIRLGSLVLGTFNLFLAFQIGRRVYSPHAGFLAALLLCISPYMSLVVSTMAMPDTPLMFFWLLALRAAVEVFFPNDDKPNYNRLLVVGFWIGLGMLSKYTAAFLWVGIGLYILIYHRRALRKWQLYAAAMITVICFLPVIMWNISNDFVSFSFHSGRVGLFTSIEPSYFLREIFGEMLYNNPLLFVMVFFVFAFGIFKKNRETLAVNRFFYCIGTPLLGIFWLISFSHPLLPHWTSPAFATMMFAVAVFLAKRFRDGAKGWLRAVEISTGCLLIVFLFVLWQVKTDGLLLTQRGVRDFSIEVNSWQQAGERFHEEALIAQRAGLISPSAPIIALRWYPAANLDFYFAKPSARKVLTIPNIERTHKYYQITSLRGGLTTSSNAWFITDDYDYLDPTCLQEYFSHIGLYKTYTVYRQDKPAKKVYLFIVTLR